MNINNCFKIGYVAKTHGLKGEVTIALMPECPDFDSIETLFLEKGGSLVPYFLKTISVTGDKAFVALEDVTSIEQASELKGQSIYLPKQERPKLSKGEFYDDEIVGFEVVQDDQALGTITDIMTAGANKLLVLIHAGKEVLIPMNGPFIKSVNKTKKKVTVDLPEGFLDI